CAGLEDDVLGPRRPRARRADEHDVRVIERCLEVDDAALRDADAAPRPTRLRVALEDVDALDHDLVLVGECAQDLARLALVLARDDDHGVAGRKVEPAALRLFFVSEHLYRTSGARLMIFMKLRSRSSRATGPKMRVPLGLLACASRTAAFSSKRMREPSGRRYSLLTRTTTALTTSPFLTWPPGCADLTVAVMMSPTDAYLR